MPRSRWVFSIVVLALLSSGVSGALPSTYLLTTRDPHILEHLDPLLEIVFERGRIRLVRIKEGQQVAPRFWRYLEPRSQGEIRIIEPSELRELMPQGKDGAARSQPDPKVQAVLSQVSADRIRKDVETLVAFSNRRAGHQDNRQATRWVAEQLQSMGYPAQQWCYRGTSEDGECNVVAHKATASGSDRIVLIEAHVDSVGYAKAGADDNASGTAGLLEIARALVGTQLSKNVVFLVTNGEERGLTGSIAYVRELESKGQLEKIDLVINMDMIAYNSNGIVDLETNPEFEALAKKFATLLQTYTPLKPRIMLNAWGSDHVPFLDRGIAALLTIEYWETKTPCYHRACDTPENLNYSYAADIIKLNVAATLDAAGF